MKVFHLLTSPTSRRRPGYAPLVLCLAVTALLGTAALLQAPAPIDHSVLNHAALSDASQFPGSFAKYSPPELYGGGAPAETCFVCNSVTADGVGTAAASVDPNNDINPATGDFSTTDPLFNIPDVGPGFKFDLSYDAQWAQSQQANHQSYSGAYGWGWGSNLNVSTSNSGGNVTVTDVNDAQMTFNLPGYQDSCPVGDYEDFQKYTYPFSAEPYCAPQRTDAQLGYLPNYNTYQLAENGGKDVYVFEATTGQLIDEGNTNSNALTSIRYSVAPGSGTCPNTTGISCIVATDSGGRTITQVVVASTGLISEVIDPANNQYTMGFSGGDYLTSVTNVAHNNAATYFSYYVNNPSPYNAQIYTLQDPNGNKTTIGYNAQGMATDESDALNHDVHYAYGNTTCTNSCLDPGESQMATITYLDGETDVDHYYQGLLTASSFGDSSSSNYNFETWTYNYSFPSSTNQDGDTTEEIVHPGAAQGTNVTKVTMDSVGNVLSSQDVNGNVTQTMYNDTGGNDLDELCWSARPGVSVPANATCSTPPAGSTSYTYDQYSNKTSETDPMGNTTRYGYYENTSPANLDGLLCWEAQPSVTGAGGACTSSSSPNGSPSGSTAYTYDSYGDQTSKVVNYGSSPSLTGYSGGYNALGEVGYTITPAGQGSGNSQSNPYATKFTYYSWGSLDTKNVPVTATTSSTTTDFYDAADNLIGVQGPLNEDASYGYNADEQQCWSVMGSYNATGTCASPPANATVTSYEGNTNAPTAVTDPNGNTTQYFYSDHAYPAKPTEVEDMAGNEITYNSYGAFGNVCVSGPVQPPQDSPTQCAPLSGDTTTHYNAAGSVLASWDASLNETTYSYGNAGYDNLVTSSTTPMSQTTSYQYDNDGRLVTTNEPNSLAASVGYNANGLKCAQAPVNNTSLGCSPSGTVGDTTYGYDGANELTTMQDNNGVSGAPPLNNYTYTNGMLTSVSDDNAKTVSYLYGYGGQVLCIAYPNGSPSCGTISSPGSPSATNTIVNYSYDTAMRVQSITPWVGTAITYSYSDPLNPTSVSQIAYPTSPTSETLGYQYDAAGNLTSATYGGPVLNGQADTFHYNQDEQLLNYSLLGGATSPNIAYNSYKQVQSAENPGQTSATTYQFPSGGDNGDITQQTTGSTTVSAGFNQDAGICWSYQGTSSNACGSPPTGATTYSYNANGQRTAATTGSTTTSNAWNAFGQMCWTVSSSSSASCSSPPSGATTYSYDGNGLRMNAITTGNKKFTWDTVSGGTTPLDLVAGADDYVYGPLLFGGTAPVAQISGSSVDYLTSIQSGVQDAFTSSGAEQERAQYSAYGVQTITSGTQVTQFGFQGSFTDTDGYIYLINRYYDPSSDQFLSIDPDVATTGQPYQFTGDDPLNTTDPLGLQSQLSKFYEGLLQEERTYYQALLQKERIYYQGLLQHERAVFYAALLQRSAASSGDTTASPQPAVIQAGVGSTLGKVACAVLMVFHSCAPPNDENGGRPQQDEPIERIEVDPNNPENGINIGPNKAITSKIFGGLLYIGQGLNTGLQGGPHLGPFPIPNPLGWLFDS